MVVNKLNILFYFKEKSLNKEKKKLLQKNLVKNNRGKS